MPEYFNYTPLLKAGLSTNLEIIGSWLLGLDYVRTMKGYTFNTNGYGDYFLWYSYEKIYSKIAAFAYYTENDNLIIIFNNFSHLHRIPFTIEQSMLTLKMQFRSEVFTKYGNLKVK